MNKKVILIAAASMVVAGAVFVALGVKGGATPVIMIGNKNVEDYNSSKENGTIDIYDFDMVAEHSAEYEEPDADGEADAGAKAETGAAQSEASLEWNNLIVISHNPPKDTKVDKITCGLHVGSALYRTFLETYQPLLAVSGHVHEAAAVDTIGKTTVINPGPLMEGCYAVVDIQKKDGAWAVTTASLKKLN